MKFSNRPFAIYLIHTARHTPNDRLLPWRNKSETADGVNANIMDRTEFLFYSNERLARRRIICIVLGDTVDTFTKDCFDLVICLSAFFEEFSVSCTKSTQLFEGSGHCGMETLSVFSYCRY